MNWLIRLYPPKWRERYGAEFEQLVQDMRPSTSRVALAADLLRGAVEARLQQGADMPAADRSAIRRGVLIAVICWLGLSVEIVLSNVVFPTRGDHDGVSVLLSYLAIFALLFVTGALAARGGSGRKGQLLAGLVAGALIGALTVATFAVVDNVWLDIVSRQQTKIDGFAGSGAGSMRAFINQGLIGAAVLLTVALGAFGAALSLVGGELPRKGPPPSLEMDPEGTTR